MTEEGRGLCDSGHGEERASLSPREHNLAMLVSVIIPTWNNPHALARCVRALDAQTFRDFDVTVVDDGSDPPIELPSGRNTRAVRVVRQRHAGAPAARNRGARETRSELVLFCDADVELVPRALARMVQSLREHPEASYAYASFRFGWKRFRSFPFDAERLQRMPYIHTTSLLRRAHFPGFDETLSRFQDWDLWLTMLEAGHRGVHIDEELFRITDTGGTMSRWLPSIAYRFPWKTARVRAYEQARARIMQKHSIEP